MLLYLIFLQETSSHHVSREISSSSVHVLDFEGVKDFELVGEYYSHLGYSFTAGAYGLIDSDAGGSGPIAGHPSGKTVMYLHNADSTVVNAKNGFIELSFYHAGGGSVSVYSELDAGGHQLATKTLVAQPRCAGTKFVCNWSLVTVKFTGIAKSIKFTGTPDRFGVDNLTFEKVPPICACVPPSDNLGWPCIQDNGVCHALSNGVCVTGTTPCTPVTIKPTFKACTKCYGSSSGPCKQADTVCQPLVHGSCPPHTTPCT
jgi:hypothetical protein